MKEKKIKIIKNKGFVKINEIALKAHVKADVFNKALHKHKAINAWSVAVVKFFEDADGKSKALDFNNGVLLVACLSKELASKIQLFASRIIYLLNQLIGKDLVFALKVEV